jgi:hypothetical protein
MAAARIASDMQVSFAEPFPMITALTGIHQSLSISDDKDDKDDNTGSSWGLPFELVLEVAAFCAGSLEFKAYLNISLASKEVHKSLKPDKSLKPVLDEPVVVWNDKTPLSDDFYEACAEGDLAQYMREHSKELPKQAKFWSKVRWVVSRHSGSVSC